MLKNPARTSHANLYEQSLVFTSTLTNQEFFKLKEKLKKYEKTDNPELAKEADDEK